jgi:class 3 adenylate cyclase
VDSGELELIEGRVGATTVHIAARVGALAAAGEVLASSSVKHLGARARIRYVDHGAQHRKGISDEWRLFAAAR